MPINETVPVSGPNDAPRRPEPYGGRYRDVLQHPAHKDGVEDGVLEIVEMSALAPSVVRVSAALRHGMPASSWTVTNPAVRILVPDGDEYVSRVYTVRSVLSDHEGVRLDIDIIVHTGESPMMRLLGGLRTGDIIPVLGPRPHFTPAFRTDRPVALFADETAIPALATILRDWPAGAEGEAWVETPDRQVVDDLPAPSGVEVHWLARTASAEPGTTGALPDAALGITGSSPVPTVWAGGEAGEMQQIRRHFRNALGLVKEDVSVFGYWRRAVSSSEIDRRRVEFLQQALNAGRDIQEIAMEELEDGMP